MQQIANIISELKMIMHDNDISQTSIINALDGKCARNTILNFYKGDADCKLSTLLMILDACGVELRLETDRSKEAILSGDIAAYRTEVDNLRSELERSEEGSRFYKERYSELIDKNTDLTHTIMDQQHQIAKQQGQIEKYMERMEKQENFNHAMYEDVQRKDAKIVELLKTVKKW